MSVLQFIASQQGRQDDVPNQELAKRLVDQSDAEGIREIVDNLDHPEKAVQSDCIKVLYEVGYLEPRLIAPYWRIFLNLLDHKNNRLVWGGMIALSTIAQIKADELHTHLQTIKDAVQRGSVITQDSGIRTLSGIAASQENYRKDILPDLFDFLRMCRTKDVPRHAESMLIALDAEHAADFIAVINAREPEMTSNQRKNAEKILKKVEKLFS